MQAYWNNHRPILLICSLVVGLLVFVVIELLWVKYNGKPVPRPVTPAGAQTIGRGPALSYVVLGDSTAVSQGGEYERGYAVRSAEHLAQSYTLTWANVGVPGARARDVAEKQLPKAAAYKPDIALLAVGANDVTHLTSAGSVKKSLLQTIDGLRRANPNVHIIMTGSPDMGAVPRFPQPLRWYAGERTNDLNKMVVQLAKEKQVVFAPIAEKTGPIFRKHPELFAADKFHPTTEGYELWGPIIIDALPK